MASPPPLPPVGPALTATKTDNTSVAVDPGATIMYTVVITNTGTVDLTNVNFTDTVDPNTTLVAGSVNSSPIAFDDTYSASGNIPIAPAASLLANDIDPDTGTNAGLTVTQVQGSAGNVGNPTNTTATGIGGVNGSVTVLANGTITYEPPPGFTGADTFTYQISDAVGKTGSGTVTINISNMVWFIDNTSVAANSRGTFSQPFKTIAAFNAVNTGAAPNPQNNHHVVLRPASGSYAEADGINLRDGQTLTGPAVAFNTVFTADANSTSAYNTFAASTGTAATITTTAGNGVDLGSGNALRGFNIGNTPGFSGVNGTAVGTLTVATVSKTGTGGAMSVSTSGAFGSTVNFGTFESTSSATNNLNLVGVTGTLGVASPGTGFTGSAAANAAINISGGSVSLTYTGNVTKATTGALLSVAGGHTGTLTFNTGTLNASSGTGLQFDNADGTYNFNGTTTLNGGDAGVDILNGSSGTFSFGSSTTITSPTGAAFNVGTSPGNPIVTYSGSITQNTSGQRVVNIDGTTGNTITFQTGTITGGASSTGVNINNSNGNVTFSNGMTMGTSGSRMTNQAVTITGGTGTFSLGVASIFTSGAAGLVATSVDGTLNCSANTVVNSTNASAININGPAGLTSLGMTLTSVTSSGGTGSGIIIQNTNGSFTVNGDGTNTTKGGNATGGTIATKDDGGTDLSGTVGTGVFLNNATNITLRRMQLNDDKNYGIRGISVNGFTLQYSTISGANGDVVNEGSIDFGTPNPSPSNGLLGSALIDNCKVSGGVEHNMQFYDQSGTLNALTISNTDIKSNSVALGGDGIQMEMDGTAAVTISIQTCLFDDNRSQAAQLNALGSSNVNLTINACTLQRTSQGNEGFVLQNAANADMVLHVTNNTSTGIGGNVILVGEVAGNASASSSMSAVVSGNTITHATTAVNNAIIFFPSSTTGQVAPSNVLIDNNTVTENSTSGVAGGILVDTPDTGSSPAFTATVTNNHVAVGDNVAGIQGIRVQARKSSAGCFDVRSNTVTFPNGTPPGVVGIRVRQSDSATAQLEQGISAGTAATVLAANNAGTTTEVIGTVSVVSNSTCQTAPTVPQPGSMSSQSTSNVTGDATAQPQDTLMAAPGQKADAGDVAKLQGADLSWMVQAAIARWVETGISLEDLSRLQAATFEITDLPDGQIASITSIHIKIDEAGAGYGWFYDQSPVEDGEFQVEVPGKELHTTRVSPARGKMDLLTVVMRELGEVYLLGKDRLPKIQRKNLTPMMEPTLSPGVRRLPLDQFRITPPTIGSIKPVAAPTQPNAAPSDTEPAANQAGTDNEIASTMSLPAEARYAVLNSAADRTAGRARLRPTPAMIRFNNASDASSYAAIRARRVGTLSPAAGMISIGPFTLPVGKSVTIMFNVTVNAANTFPPGTTQVCNQGSITTTQVPGPTLTDDPDVAGTQSTCTALNVADLSVTKSAGSPTTCSTSNIVYTIGYHNAGPANAVAVVVSDPMPAGTSLVSAPAPANWTRTDSVPVGGNGTIMFARTGASPNGESQNFTVTVSIDGTVTDGQVLSNTASVTSTTPDPNTANNTSSPVTMLTVKKPPTTATVGAAQTICALGTTTALGGNTPTIGTGTWTVQSGGTGTFNPSATTPGATLTHLTGTGPIVLRWTISNPPCTDSFAEVTVTVRAQPTATVGGPQTICALGTTASLGGNTPTFPATGTWSIVTPSVVGTFNPNATTPGATFTHTSGGIGTTITLRWTVSNAPCTDATADVLITIKSQPTATVGGPQTICGGGTTMGLGGNTPAAGETGTWSIVTAGITGTFNPNANSPNATFTHSTGATSPFVLRWTVTNPPCTAASADVSIALLPSPISTNGGPQTICESGTTAGLGGNTPAMGETGTWSIVTGGATGTFTPSATTPNATFTPTSAPGTITLRWTVTNPTCGASTTSDAIITVKQQPTATVGGPQTICALGTTGSLGGNTPAGGATGMWSIVTGGATGTFNPNANAPGATFSHATGSGVITLRWTVSNPPCSNATADVMITITQPPSPATVGGNQTICALGTTASLGGNTPTTGTGMWSVQSGGTGTFNPNASTPGATFTHATGTGPIVLRWTISNPPCPDSFAQVTITITQPPNPATVGGNQTICALGTTNGLGGNTPTSGTGMWTVQSGGTGTFNPNASTPNATFTHLTGTGPIVLRWTISNPPCPDSFAELTISITQSPTSATVGGNQTICALGTSTGLGGNTPASGTGTWTVQNGGTGTFNPNASTPNATFTHLTGVGPIVLRWTISNPPCANSFAEVTITISQSPSTATVGKPQTICNGSTTAGLGGNTPASGSGTWSIQTGGASGTFNPNASTPNATFTPTSGPGTIVVRWTISNPPCPDSFADVTITVKQAPTATAGGNQTICANGTTASLGGNTPTGGATGMWSVVSGGTGTFNPNATTPGTTFTHTGGAGPIIVRWTVSNSPCPNATADVVITITQPPTTATVGPNQTISPGGTTAPLGGNSPAIGTGMWSIVTPGATGTFNPNASTPNATWTHLTGSGEVTLRWTISNPPCPSSQADVMIQIGVAPTITCPSSPVMANAAPGQCSASVSFTVTATGIPAPTVTCIRSDTNATVTSPATFNVGSTTVTCTATNGIPPNAMCSFVVQVKDTQPPVITCPASVTSVTPDIGGTSAVVTYPAPTATDNCPGVTAVCNPPSASTFPVGCTIVTCTATDASNNTATCTFQVCVFNVCLQDDSNSTNRLLINTVTGDYRWCCGGVTYIGKGKITQHGSIYTLEHNTVDRRVRAIVTGSAKSGNASLQSPPGMIRCNLIDRRTNNNTTCATCQ